VGAGPVVRLSSAPAGSAGRAGGRDSGGAGGHGGGADVPVPGAVRHPVYSDRMGNNDVFAVIADKTLRGILAALKDGERPVGDLVAELGVSQPTVSKHLKILREAGMVSMEAQGQRRLYAVQPEPLAEVTAWVHEVVGGAAHEVAAPMRAPEDAAGTDSTGTGVAVTGAPGTSGRDPEVTPGTDVVEAAAVLVPAPIIVPGQESAVEPAPELPVGGTPARPSRGAGARAVGILSSLSGLRRRTRNPRR
jgi:DNA-binding transcriptional ArsR family regulator